MSMLKRVGVLTGSLLLFSGIAHARLFETVPDKAVLVHYRIAVAAATASTSAVLIDLSDTTNWPHKENGYLGISSIRVGVDKAAASTTTVKIGVINFINSSTSSITWFVAKENLLNVSNTEPEPFINQSPCYYNLYVEPGSLSDGATPNILSNLTTSGSTVFQNDLILPAPNGGVAPGVGDVVVTIDKTSLAAATYWFEIIYHSNRK